MAAERHGIYTASFDSLVVNQIRSVSASPGVNLLIARPGGALDPALVGNAFADPFVNLTTTDLATLIAGCGVTAPLVISSAAEFQFQRRTNGGTFDGAGSHTTLNSTAGVLFIERISASQDSTTGVELSARFVPHWDGTTLPIEVNTGQNLANNPAHNQTYFMGPVSFAGALLDGVVGWSLSTGIGYKTYRCNGEHFARQGHVYMRDPSFEITVLRQSFLNTTDLFLYALDSGGIVAYAQKAVHGSARVAKANAAHVSLTMATGAIDPTRISVASEGDTTITYRVTGISTISAATTATIGI